jgi:streptomycin 3"-adenylyltransferase
VETDGPGHWRPDPVSAQAGAVLAVLADALPPGRLTGLYLYGSAVAGGLRPDSDLDLFGVIERPSTDEERRAVVDGLVPISWLDSRPRSWRPVELSLAVADDVRPWRYPPRLDFQYGEWLRDALLAGEKASGPVSNPDGAILAHMVRSSGVPLLGPPAAALLDEVPRTDLVRAVLDELSPLLGDLERDTRNVLLTLARMWVTVATGEVRSKDAAAAWAIERLPSDHRPVLELARAAYLGKARDAWGDMGAVRSHAALVVRRIEADASHVTTAHPLPGADASV